MSAPSPTIAIVPSARIISQGDLFGVPAIGKKIEWQGISIYHIVDGKVLEEKRVEDFLPILIQLDLISQANPNDWMQRYLNRLISEQEQCT